MFERAFITSEICVTKAIGLVYFWKEVNEAVLNTLSHRDQGETKLQNRHQFHFNWYFATVSLRPCQTLGAVFRTQCNMKTFDFLVIFKQQSLLLLILLSLAHAEKGKRIFLVI